MLVKGAPGPISEEISAYMIHNAFVFRQYFSSSKQSHLLHSRSRLQL